MLAGRVLGRLIIAVVAGVAGSVAPTVAATSHAAPATSVGELYVTNRDSDNIAVFAIGPTGLPVPVGSPVATADEPRGIVFTPDGTKAYVVNSGANTVSAYHVDARGALRPLGAPVATQGEFAHGIAIAPNGRSLYVTNFDSGTIAAFGINEAGTLALLGPPVHDSAANPRGLAVSADGRFVFVGHGLPDDATGVLTTFAIRGGGRLAPVGQAVPSGGAGSGMTVSPDGRFLYVAAIGADAVFGYRIGRVGDLTPAPGSPFPAADRAEGLTITADGRHLYVANPGEVFADPGHAVSAFTVGADGALIPVPGSPFTAEGGPIGIAATPDGRFLYVSSFSTGTISAFAIMPTGALREIQGSPLPSGGLRPAFQSLAIRPTQQRRG